MNEDKWIANWKQISHKEKEILEKNRGDFKKIAMEKSNDIFNKIKATMKVEAILSLVVALVFPFLFLEAGYYFWIMTALMLAALIVTLKVYWDCWKGLSHIQEKDIVSSLARKTQILAKYIRTLKFICYFFGLVGFVVGFNYSLFESNSSLETEKLGITIALSIPILGLFYWLINKYIYGLYGRHLKSIKAVYQNLVNGVG